MAPVRNWDLRAASLSLCLFLSSACGGPAPSGTASDNALPRLPQAFNGIVGRTVAESKSDFPVDVAAPKGAPNVLLILTDDVGFSAASTFGGAIPTPTFDRLAQNGLRYNTFQPRPSAPRRAPPSSPGAIITLTQPV
jgi:arylsulfatase